MLSLLIPSAEASIVSPKGTPSRNIRTAACPFVSTQSSVTPFQHHVETAAINVATRLRPQTGTPAARTNPKLNGHTEFLRPHWTRSFSRLFKWLRVGDCYEACDARLG